MQTFCSRILTFFEIILVLQTTCLQRPIYVCNTGASHGQPSDFWMTLGGEVEGLSLQSLTLPQIRHCPFVMYVCHKIRLTSSIPERLDRTVIKTHRSAWARNECLTWNAHNASVSFGERVLNERWKFVSEYGNSIPDNERAVSGVFIRVRWNNTQDVPRRAHTITGRITHNRVP